MFPVKNDIPIRQIPYTTALLILINTLIFLLEWILGPAPFIWSGGLIPSRFMTWIQSPWVLSTLFTSTYLHGGWSHLLSNMLYLWIFGKNVEEWMGSLRFFFFYTLCGSAAGLAQIAVDPEGIIPSIGASGSVAGVLGAYLLLYPQARVYLLIPLFIWSPLVPVKAGIVLLWWFVTQFFNGVILPLDVTMRAGGIAWWAHIGGFFMGMLVVALESLVNPEEEGSAEEEDPLP